MLEFNQKSNLKTTAMSSKKSYSVLVVGPTTKKNFLVKVTKKLNNNASEMSVKYFYMTPEGKLYIPPKHNPMTLSDPIRGSQELAWALSNWRVKNPATKVTVNFLKGKDREGSDEAKMFNMVIALAKTVYEKPIAKVQPIAANPVPKPIAEPVKTDTPVKQNLVIAHCVSAQVEKFNTRKEQQKKLKVKDSPNNLGENLKMKSPGILEHLKSAFS